MSVSINLDCRNLKRLSKVLLKDNTMYALVPEKPVIRLASYQTQKN
jgi:hypothetical protein